MIIVQMSTADQLFALEKRCSSSPSASASVSSITLDGSSFYRRKLATLALIIDGLLSACSRCREPAINSMNSMSSFSSSSSPLFDIIRLKLDQIDAVLRDMRAQYADDFGTIARWEERIDEFWRKAADAWSDVYGFDGADSSDDDNDDEDYDFDGEEIENAQAKIDSFFDQEICAQEIREEEIVEKEKQFSEDGNAEEKQEIVCKNAQEANLKLCEQSYSISPPPLPRLAVSPTMFSSQFAPVTTSLSPLSFSISSCFSSSSTSSFPTSSSSVVSIAPASNSKTIEKIDDFFYVADAIPALLARLDVIFFKFPLIPDQPRSAIANPDLSLIEIGKLLILLAKSAKLMYAYIVRDQAIDLRVFNFAFTKLPIRVRQRYEMAYDQKSVQNLIIFLCDYIDDLAGRIPFLLCYRCFQFDHLAAKCCNERLLSRSWIEIGEQQQQ